ncbi:hypothetical protein ACFV8E_19715 [Streptomyces sp. NPDC059849]
MSKPTAGASPEVRFLPYANAIAEVTSLLARRQPALIVKWCRRDARAK